MKALVAVKRVVDHNVKVRPKSDGSDVDVANVKMSINPFDEIAVEEAIRLKEKGAVSEIVAVAIGTSNTQDVLRHALAMGADRAILIDTDAAIQPLTAAKILKAVVEREQPRLIITGKQAIDDDAAETGQMLAALLNVAQATFASKIEIHGEHADVTREIDGGQEVLAVKLPAVVTADLRLNEPRFVKLPNLMQAKKKPIETLKPADIGVDVAPKIKLLNVAEPPARKPGVKVSSVQELVEKLRNEAKVLP